MEIIEIRQGDDLRTVARKCNANFKNMAWDTKQAARKQSLMDAEALDNILTSMQDDIDDVAGDLASLPYSASPSVGGNSTISNAILFGRVDGTSTSTMFTATVPGLDRLYDGVAIMLKNGVVTSASGFTINVNGLGAKPVYTNMAAATAETTKFNVNYTMLFVYDSTRVTDGAWLCYNGYDSNSNTIGYQLRGSNGTLPLTDKCYRYRLLFTSADHAHLVPANTSTSTNATAARTTNTTPIDPFGPIYYYGSTSSLSAGGTPGTGVQWQQYSFSLGYSFNSTGAALAMTYPAPVFLRCLPNADGSAIMEECVQALPISADGRIYIYLGRAYSATNIELEVTHQVYWHNGTGIRIWTGGA